MSLRCRLLPRSRADITWGISVVTAALSLLAPGRAQGPPAAGAAPPAGAQTPPAAVVVGAPKDAPQAAVADRRPAEQQEVDGWLKALADKQEKAALEVEQTQKLAGLQERVRGEGQKNTAAQQWQPLAEAITTFAKDLAADSP